MRRALKSGLTAGRCAAGPLVAAGALDEPPASRHLRRRIAEATAALDLSDTELIVVWLCSGGGRVQVDLAAATGISPAQMVASWNGCVRVGLVAMHRQARDRRRQIWLVTRPASAVLISGG